jgi:LytS/YehU family sensor histidine kinase
MDRAILSLVLFCGMGFLISHLLYLFVRRRRWLQMPIGKAWPRLAASLAIAGMPLAATVILANFFLFHATPSHELLLRPQVLLVVWFNHTAVLVLWMVLYVAVNEFRRRRLAEVNALRLELVAQEAHLRGLRAQLNPHFLFNCLNSLRELILENPQSAQKMVTQLSALLRYSLQSNQIEMVALAEEVRAVKDYLDLEAVRFEDRLQVQWNIASEAAAATVPPMLLQTLVENALKHGIARRSEGGQITITAQSHDSLIHLEVVNSGSLPESPSLDGIGLRNARTRLRLLYGERGSIVLESIPEGRVRAAVSLPFIKTEVAQ